MNAHHPHGSPQPTRTALPTVRHPVVLFREPLAVGDRVRSLHASRIGTVLEVYPDGSASVAWDDKPAPLCLGHARVPRALLLALPSSVTESEGGEL